jgi:parvulin-like peptidyl-prolyl isomerase
MQPGQISGPLSVQNKGVVIALLDKQQPTPADYDKQKEQVREQLLNEKRGEVMNLFAEKLHERMQKDGQIKVNPTEAKKLFGANGVVG